MIRLPETAPSLPARRQLRRWQAELDGLASYGERVEAASETFKARNTPRNPTFRSVREHLPEARAQAYKSYRARLKEYIAERGASAPHRRLNRIILGIQAMDHPTVWAEMKRQHGMRPLHGLFTKAPEALRW